MTLLFIVFLSSTLMLHLFINISKLFLDNIFVAGLLHSCVVLHLIFLFGWDSKNSDISIHLCLIDFAATYGIRTSKSNFLKNSPKNFTFAFLFPYQIQQEALELVVYSDFAIDKLFTTFVLEFLRKLPHCRFPNFQSILSQAVEEE